MKSLLGYFRFQLLLGSLLVSVPTATCASRGGSPRSLSSADVKTFLAMHNMLRETALPPATAMNFVTWSSTLEALAKVRARKCTTVEKLKASGGYKGPNQSRYTGRSTDPQHIVKHWFDEGRAYQSNATFCRPGCNCQHYVNIMSSALSEIGCAISTCNNGTYSAVCLYSQYYNGRLLYNEGPTCSQCPPDKPLCLFDMCISAKVAKAPETLEMYPKVTDHLRCKLKCQNCGTLVSTELSCTCNCLGALGTGQFCENANGSKSLKTCPPCLTKLVCLNGGNVSAGSQCVCLCPKGVSGQLCEIDEHERNNSIGFSIKAVTTLVKRIAWPQKSAFHTKIWPRLQSKMAEIVGTFCRSSKSRLAQCCWRTASDFDNVSGDIGASNVKLNESSIERNHDGSLYMAISVAATKSMLCLSSLSSAALASGLSKGANPQYMPLNLLLRAVKDGQSEIAKELANCCADVTLKNVNFATGPDSAANKSQQLDDALNSDCHEKTAGLGQRPMPSAGSVPLTIFSVWFLFTVRPLVH